MGRQRKKKGKIQTRQKEKDSDIKPIHSFIHTRIVPGTILST